MDVILDFIVEYYIWILGISIFLILVLIGYIADQKRKLKKIKEEKNKEGQGETPIENTPIPETVNINTESNEVATPVVEELPPQMQVNEFIDQPIFEPIKEENREQVEEIDSSLFAPMGDMNVNTESVITDESPIVDVVSEPEFVAIQPEVVEETIENSVQPEITSEPVEEIIDLNTEIIEDSVPVETIEPTNNAEVIEEIVNEPQNIVNTWEPELIEENKDIISN